MRKPRTFTAEFKRQVVEEMLSGATRATQLCRRYNLSRDLVYYWKKQYAKGKLNNEPDQELTLENEFEELLMEKQKPTTSCQSVLTQSVQLRGCTSNVHEPWNPLSFDCAALSSTLVCISRHLSFIRRQS